MLEDILINLYIDFWRTLKQRVGTSSGFNGMSDYLVFRYLLKRIERHFGMTFAVEQCTPNTCIFSSECLLLTSNVTISKFDSHAPEQKTDIAVFTRNSIIDPWRIIAAFEIKIGVGDQKILNDMLRCFSSLLTCSDALVFPVVFNSLNVGPQYKSQLDTFCERSNGRAFIISRSDLNYQMQIGLNEAIEKCLAKVSVGGEVSQEKGRSAETS
jgi:hypothetical protein